MNDFDTLPKIKFQNAQDAIPAFFAQCAGKIIVVSDAGAFPAVKEFTAAPRAITLVLDAWDALPLFAVSEGAGGVLAAGGEEVMALGRAFATITRLPCLLLPADAGLGGVYEREASVLVEKTPRVFSLNEYEAALDERLVAPTLGEAYARLLLSRLAIFEADVLEKLAKIPKPQICEKAYPLLTREAFSARDVVEINSVLRILERDGLPRGEGYTLAKMLSCPAPMLCAYLALRALYTAFFAKGKPCAAVPNYALRAEVAGVPYASMEIPTPEMLAQRSIALEQIRGLANAELAIVKRAEGRHLREIAKYSETRPVSAADALKLLPERGRGLSAVIRDFGLMEGI